MIVFKQIDEGASARLVMKDAGYTWTEVTDEFIHFLQACGYVVNGIDVADYLSEQFAFQRKEKADVFINGQQISLPTKKGKRHAKKRKSRKSNV